MGHRSAHAIPPGHRPPPAFGMSMADAQRNLIRLGRAVRPPTFYDQARAAYLDGTIDAWELDEVLDHVMRRGGGEDERWPFLREHVGGMPSVADHTECGLTPARGCGYCSTCLRADLERRYSSPQAHAPLAVLQDGLPTRKELR